MHHHNIVWPHGQAVRHVATQRSPAMPITAMGPATNRTQISSEPFPATAALSSFPLCIHSNASPTGIPSPADYQFVLLE
jgi:hypothetical protein